MTDTKIIARPTLEANVYEFVLDSAVTTTKSSYLYQNHETEEAKTSPLLRALFALGEIEQILLAEQMISIRKTKQAVWPSLSRKVGQTIRATLTAHQAIMTELKPVTLQQQEVDLIEIQRVVDTVLNPQVAQHGGHIKITAIKDKTAYVEMSGGCQGCSQSAMTLKHGVEKVIKHHFPAIVAVVDTTAHQEGAQPFYA